MSRTLRWYVASSWRNDEQPAYVKLLRELDQSVYDFRNPVPGDNGFAWHQTAARAKPWDGESLKIALADPIAEQGFSYDMTALRECDVCLLLMPAGISANLELGYAVGAGKTTIVYIGDHGRRVFEPELMWKMADHLVTSQRELLDVIAGIIAPKPPALSAVA